MKKVAFPSLVILSALLILSCKNETNDFEANLPDELAVTDTSETNSFPEHLYVTAYSGLTLREFNNVNSEKLAIMPYGTKVRILTPEETATMTVGGIKGGMHEVEFNHKKGFAFSGYLSKFFPPEEDIKASVYSEELKTQFPGVSFTETTGGTASNPSTTQTFLLPTTAWHEAFYIAQRLFKIPAEFAFPLPSGSNEEIVKDKNLKKNALRSELIVQRKENDLERIRYVYRSKGYGYEVTISREGDKMKLERTETAE